jgi:hypothetical protein
MAKTPEQRGADQRVSVPKVVSLKEDGYYTNCFMVETTPFDISLLFGKVRPKTEEQGQVSFVEVYEKQVYLSHVQARALFEALGRVMQAISGPRPVPDAEKPPSQ